MRNRNLKNKVLVVIACLSFTVLSFSQGFDYVEERALAQDVFKSLQNEDLELFKTYCATPERFTKMLAEMGNETEMEKEIKGELSGMSSSEFLEEAIEGFNKALALATSEGVDLKDGTYAELGIYDTQFEVTNLKSMTVAVSIFEDNSYSIKLDLLKTADDLFIYDFDLRKGGVN